MEKLYPSALAYIEVWLGEDPLETLMIDHKFESLAEQVVTPFLKSMDYRQELEIVCGVVLLMLPKLTRFISYGMLVLLKNPTYTLAAGINDDFKSLVKIR